MNVLIIGGGGREHALAWKVAQSSRVNTVYVAPGNAGTAGEPGIENVALDVMDFAALADFVGQNEVELTIVGPEAPLVDGIVDFFPFVACAALARVKVRHNSKVPRPSPKISWHGITSPAPPTVTLLNWSQHWLTCAHRVLPLW